MRPLFTPNQIKRVSNILDNAGQVVLGSLLLNPLIDRKLDQLTTISGILALCLTWWYSLRLERISTKYE